MATTLGALGSQAKVLSDHDPADPLARRVVVFEADPKQVAMLRQTLPLYATIEPLVYRHLHHRRPPFLREAVRLDAHLLRRGDNRFRVSISAGGRPLSGAEVLLYISDGFRSVNPMTATSDAQDRSAY